LLIVWSAFGSARAQPAADFSPADLKTLRPGHPRLLLTDDGLASALAAAKTDPLRAELNRRIIATAEFILTAPPVRQPDNETSHEQDRYAVYYVLTSAMAYRLTGDERFLARAKNDLLTISAFTDWDPQHFLSVGEMSFAVAIGYDWLYPKLKPAERAVIKRALMEKALSFTETIYGYRTPTNGKAAWSGKAPGNWNNVVNNGMLSAALAIADEEPLLASKTIAGARKSLVNGMDSYAPDGGYPEGPGYWSYATTYSAIGIAELESALGSDLGLASSPGFDQTLNYYEAVQGPFGPVFNYGDATDDLQISPVRTWLAKRFQEPFALHHMRTLLADFLNRGPVVKFDRGIQGTVINRFLALHEVWFPGEPAGPVTNLPLDFHFRGDADIATFRSAWNDTNAIFSGLKAGNSSAGHGHLDLGSFFLDANGQRWAMDLGPDNTRGDYTLPGYFNVTKKEQRWTYFRANNHGHNTVTPGDRLQNRHITAPITKFGSAPERAFAVVDLTPAYANAVVSLHRGMALLDRARVLVQDEYQPAQTNLPLHWVMITPAKIELANDGHSALLTNNGRTLRVDLLEPVTAKLSLGSTQPPNPAENQNTGTSMLAIDLNSSSSENIMRLAVLLTPIGDQWPKLGSPRLEPLNNW